MSHDLRWLRQRRLVLKGSLALPVLLWLPRASAQPTPECGDDADLTPAQTAGPFYTPASPEKADFRPDDPAGKPVSLRARLLDTGCRPLPGAVVELWHADSSGRYDNDGFRLRGYQRADAQGNVVFRTVLPGKYPYRTRHFHVRILHDGRRLLTTQLYFPDEPGNADDGLFQPELLLALARSGGETEARFSFVVRGAA